MLGGGASSIAELGATSAADGGTEPTDGGADGGTEATGVAGDELVVAAGVGGAGFA